MIVSTPGKQGGKAILAMGTTGREKLPLGVVNDLPLEVFKQGLDELLLWTSISALDWSELREL